MSTLKVDAIRHNSATSDAITTAADGTCTAKLTSIGGGGLSHRNIIINGAMNVAQRGTSFSAVQNTFTLDRFKFKRESTAANFTMAQSTTSPDGFSKSLKMTCTAADTSTAHNEFVMVRYNIEAQDLQSLGYGTASAKPLVLSFYVRSSLTGVYGINFLQIDNSNKIYSRTYTINSANTWEKKTISIPADTSGVINDDNGVGLQINFCLVIGSSYKGSAVSSAYESYANDKFASQHGVNFASSTSNDWYLTGVQLETGDTATTFEHRSFTEELTRCYRYYRRFGANGALPTPGVYNRFSIGYSTSSSFARYAIHLDPPMRINPADSNFGHSGSFNIQPGSLGSGTIDCDDTACRVDLLIIRVDNASFTSGTGSGVSLHANNDATAYIDISAEL